MSLSDHPRAYGTAAVAAAFVAGILVTLGFKDFYPDLEWRYERKRRGGWRRSSLFFTPVQLENHEEDERSAAETALPGTDGSRFNGVVEGIEGCIGNTPLVKIRSLSEATGCEVMAKAEFLNGAGGSPKDRVALNMIRAGEAAGLLVPGRGDTIYEGTVGSTGISLATLARARGYRAHIFMPDDQAVEKSTLLHHLGATVERVAVAPITSPNHYVNLARRRACEHTAAAGNDPTASRGFFADQFENPANFAAHLATTAPEIFRQTGGRIDAFVAGAGTGGTLAGVAKYLKEEAPVPTSAAGSVDGGKKGISGLRVILADPQGSGLYNRVKHGVMYSPTEREGTRRRQQVDSVVEGIGVNRVTNNFEAGRHLVNDAVRVTDAQAYAMGHWLAANDGIFVGSSSAVNCVAAVVTALAVPPGSRVVTILSDSGTRHLSKFWKHIAEMGLEDNEEDQRRDLLSVLGIQAPPSRQSPA